MNRNLRRERLFAGVDLSGLRGLEIGPLNAPLVYADESHVSYIDHASTDELKAKYSQDANVDTEAIVDVDYVWSGSLVETVGGQSPFDYIVASHVIEHVPNALGWLEELETVLTPGGVIYLVIPDRRFTFDLDRRESSFAQMLTARLRGLTRPDAGQVIDAVLNSREVDMLEAWRSGLPGCGLPLPRPLQEVLNLATVAESGERYVDVHCWVFTPESFAGIMRQAVELGITTLGCLELRDTEEGEFEFYATLGAHMGRDRAIASWVAAADRAQQKGALIAARHDEVRRMATGMTAPSIGSLHIAGESQSTQGGHSVRDPDAKNLGVQPDLGEVELVQATAMWRRSLGLSERSNVPEPMAARLVASGVVPVDLFADPGAGIESVQIEGLGPLGNSLVQLSNAIELAEHLQVPKVLLIGNAVFPAGITRLSSGVSIEVLEPQSALPEPAGIAIRGNLFRPTEFGPVTHFSALPEFEAILSGEVGRRDLRDLLQVTALASYRPTMPDGSLTIHIRSGDIFRGMHAPGYGQPPLAYYEAIVDSGDWTAISVVFEDDSNPVVAPLIAHCQDRFNDVRLVSGSVLDDAGHVLCAKTVVASRGTFVPAIAGISPDIERVYTFAQPMRALGGRPLEVVRVDDAAGLYVKEVCNYNWENSAGQRRLMVSYPKEALRFR